jgi:hypothetical protein
VKPTVERWIFVVAIVVGVVPLWAAQALPLVDLPQHLHLISVLHRLNDSSTLYPEFLSARGELTPYLGYYYAVSALNWLFPLELANRLFLTAYVAGLPLSAAFLLRSLKRGAWPALLTLPFAYGDSFAWGFINYCASLPLALITCGFFIRCIEDEARRRQWAVAAGLTLIAVLLFHVQVFAFLGLALPALLLMTAANGPWIRARIPALVSVCPAVLLFIGWVGLRLGAPAEIAPGQPWKAWGPLLSEKNLAFKPFAQNRAEFFSMLGNMLPDGGDQRAVTASAIVAAAATLLALVTILSGDKVAISVPRLRVVALAALALLLYFTLPFDIRGYMYYLNTRYAHLAAALCVLCIPVLKERWERLGLFAALGVAVLTAFPLAQGFRQFDTEAASLNRLVAASAPKPKVMGLMFNTQSAAMTHPVFLHASTVLARERGGLTNFSFALTPHSPLKYRDLIPPTFPSEWRPEQMNYETQGRFYDHFLVRGVHPGQIFGPKLEQELYIAAEAGGFWLVRRR